MSTILCKPTFVSFKSSWKGFRSYKHDLQLVSKVPQWISQVKTRYWMWQRLWHGLNFDECTFNTGWIKKKLYGPFLWIGFNCLKATATLRRPSNFYHSVPRNSWCSFYQPQKDERLSRPWSQPIVLSTGSLDWESSILTTRPLSSIQNLK